jgi:hypothetical protein
MAPVAELPVDGLAYRGFTTILYDVLDSLGVPTEQIKYVCRGEPRPDGFKGHIVVHLKVPASEFVPVLRDAHDYLKTGPYRLLPAALDLNRFSEPQITAADRAARDEVDPCLRASA